MSRSIKLLFSVLLLPLNTMAQSSPKQITPDELAVYMAVACANGAVEAAYSLGADKLSGDSARDSVTIANASKRKCVNAAFMNAHLPKNDPITAKDKEFAGIQALSAYAEIIAQVVRQRGATVPSAK